MKLLTEFTRQFSFTEWFKAFWNHVPTAGKKAPKSGYKLAYQGGTMQERTEALQKLKESLKTKFE